MTNKSTCYLSQLYMYSFIYILNIYIYYIYINVIKRANKATNLKSKHVKLACACNACDRRAERGIYSSWSAVRSPLGSRNSGDSVVRPPNPPDSLVAPLEVRLTNCQGMHSAGLAVARLLSASGCSAAGKRGKKWKIN